MSKVNLMIDQTNKRLVELILPPIKEDWIKVRDVLSNEVYLQERKLLKRKDKLFI